MCLKSILTHLLLAMIFQLIGVNASSLENKIKMFRIDNCPGEHNLTISATDIHVMKMNGTHFLVNGYFEVLENITDPSLVGRLSAKRCEDVENEENCLVYIEDIHDHNMCEALEDGFLANNLLFSEMKPRMRCPIQMGKYYFQDAVFDNEFVSQNMLNVNANFILIKITFQYQNRSVLCADVWIQIHPIHASHDGTVEDFLFLHKV